MAARRIAWLRRLRSSKAGRRFRRRREPPRRPLLETYEPRLLLASDWQNPFVTRDASGDGVVVPQDVLIIVNELNQRTVSGPNGALPARANHPDAPYWSTDGDDFVAPQDVLLIVNALNSDSQQPTITVQLVQDTAPGGATNSDRITSDPRLTGRATDNLTGVTGLKAQVGNGPQVAVPMNRDGSFTFLPGLALDGADDGQLTVRFTVLDGRQHPSASDMVFTLDTRAPDSFQLGLAPESDTQPPGDGRTTQGLVSLVGQTLAGGVVQLPDLGKSTVADTSGAFRFEQVSLHLGHNAIAAEVIDPAGNVGVFTGSVVRESASVLVTLREQDDFVVEGRVPVPLGQQQGGRTIQIDLSAIFDLSDETSTASDTFLIYLVDPADPTQTLLDRGEPGTSLFAWSGGRADFVPGLVLFDGTTVDIDVSSLGFLTDGQLLFQLINADRDTGTQVSVLSVDSIANPAGAARSRFALNQALAVAGGSLDMSALAAAQDISVQLQNVRFDSVTGHYVAELALENRGAAAGRTAAVVFPGLPPGVHIVNPSGLNQAGEPYLNLSPAILPGGLDAGSTSRRIRFEFDNAELTQFPLVASVLMGPPNRAPVIEPLGPWTVMSGEVREVQLAATDPDGDPVTFAIPMADDLPTMRLAGDGRLTISPQPNQTGQYVLNVFAHDGSVRAMRQVMLNVTADPDTTTRVSGHVLRTDGQPLAGVQVEVGAIQGLTAADGSFLLDLGSGPVVGDTLKVRGELLAGPDAYPFIAEKLAFILDHDLFAGANNLIPRPIYLPVLDVAGGTRIDPMQDMLATSASVPGASVFIAAGTLMDQQGTAFDGTLSITEVPVDRTPAALPNGLRPGLVVTIQPGEMVFTTPAPLTLPNRGGYPAGTRMDLWSINPVTGEFDLVGAGEVSFDGAMITTTSGGIRNSSWHFVVPPATPPAPHMDKRLEPPPSPPPAGRCGGTVPDAPEDSQTGVARIPTDLSDDEIVFRTQPYRRLHEYPQVNSVGAAAPQEVPPICPPTGPEVDPGSGSLTLPVPLFAYQSYGAVRGLSLEYDSLRADPNPILSFGVEDVIWATQANDRLVARVTVSKGDFQQQVPGYTGALGGLAGGENFWDVENFGYSEDNPGGGSEFRAALRADLRDQPTGIYDYELQAGVLRIGDTAATGSLATVGGKIISVNSRNSPFGVGWGMGGLEELVVQKDGSVLIVNGDGKEDVFTWDATSGAMIPSMGDFSTLTKNADGSYRRTLVDQTAYDYSPTGVLDKVTHRTGQQTHYVYDDERRLIKVVDPAGLESLFLYDGPWVSRITDPAGRVTRLDHDAAGFLTRITYADNTKTDFTYNSRGLISSFTTDDGKTYRFEYDENGRLSKFIDPDDTAREYQSAASRSVAVGDTTQIEGAPSAIAGDDTFAIRTQPYGNVTRIEFLEQGMGVVQSDSLGPVAALTANFQALEVSNTDARGFVTTMQYDGRGNLIRKQDGISASPEAYRDLFADPLLDASATMGEILVRDVNRDGFPDVVFPASEVGSETATEGSFGIGLLLGRFDGSLGERVYYPLATTAGIDTSIVKFPFFTFANPWTLEDVDQDEDLDLLYVAAASDNPRLQVLRNNGDGVFGAAETIPLPDGTQAIRLLAGDINGDRHPDVVLADLAHPSLWALLNDGLGGLGGPIETVLPAAATAIALGDLDGDDRLDVVFGTHNRAASLGWLAGQADGTFSPFTLLQADRQVLDLRLANFTGDEELDLAYTDIAYNFVNGLPEHGLSAVQLLEGAGDGTFVARSATPIERAMRWLGVSDLDGDDDLDLVVQATQDTLVLANQGNGSFARTQQIATPTSRGVSAGLGDVDGDGHPDLLNSRFFRTDLRPSSPTNLALLRGRGNATLGDVVVTTLGQFELPTSFAVGDLNGDQKDDVVIGYGTIGPKAKTVETYLGDGTGHFTSQSVVPAAFVTAPNAVQLADLDGDGHLDLIVALSFPNAIQLRRGDGAGGFGPATTIDVDSESFVYAVEDVDGDGDLDLAVAEQFSSSENTVVLYANDGQGNFGPKVTLGRTGLGPFYFIAHLAIADMNRDGIGDIVFDIGFFNDTRYFWYRGVRDQLPVGPAQMHAEFGVSPRTFAIADFNGDGNLDVLAQPSGGNDSMLLGNGLGGLRKGADFPPGLGDRFQAADVDGDGDLDVASQGRFDGQFSVYLNDGAGTFPQSFDYASGFRFVTGQRIIPLALGDVDGDDAPDVVLVDPVSQQLRTHFNRREDVGLPGGMQYGYDPVFNRVTSITDQLGRQTVITLDPQTGERASITQVVGTPGGGDDLLTTYTYNAAGFVETMTDALGRVTRYEYGDFCRLIRVIFAMGTPDEAERRFEYDSAGNLTKFTDENGSVTTYTYDIMNRLIRTALPDPDGPGGPLAPPVLSRTYDSVGNLLTETDANGGMTQYTYDNQDRLLTMTDPAGGTSRFTYDVNDNVVGVTDPLGRTTAFAYDLRNRLVAVTDALGGVITQAWDGDGNLIEVVNERGSRTSMSYDARNRLIQATDATGASDRFDYDLADQLIRVTDKNGNVTSHEFDSLNRHVATVDARGGRSRFVYDAVGNMLVSQDALARVTQYSYDNLDRWIRTIDPLGQEATVIYDDIGNVLSLTDTGGAATAYAYDALHRLIRMTDALGGVATYTYDPMSNRTSQTDELGRTTTYRFDALHRLTQIVDRAGQVQTIEYDATGNPIRFTDPLGRADQMTYDALDRLVRLTDPRGGVVTAQYDAAGNLVAVTDPLGHTTTFAYDDLNRLVASTDPLGKTSTLAYDRTGNQTVFTDELGRRTRFQYDQLHRPTVVTDPLAGKQRMTYDAVGNLVTYSDALERVTHFSYDALDRVIATQDALAGNTTHQYSPAGNLIRITDELGLATQFAYDRLDRLIEVTDPLNGQQSYEYDAVGNRVRTTDRLGRVTTYKIDSLDRVIETTDPLGGVTTYAYDAVGNVVAITDKLSHDTHYAYDELDRLAELTDALGASRHWSYDLAGNLVEETDKLGRVTRYRYDSLNRLTRKIDALDGEMRYEYDAVGNLAAWTDELGRETTFTWDDLDRRVESKDPLGGSLRNTYDAVGNLLSVSDPLGRVSNFAYDALDRMTQSVDPLGHASVFGYDAAGRLIHSTDALGRLTQFEYDGLDRPVRVVDALGQPSTSTYDAVGNLLSTTDALGRTSRYTYDDLDRRVTLTDPLGNLSTYDYDAMGNLLSSANALGHTSRYEYDARYRTVATVDPLGARTSSQYDAVDNLIRFSDASGNDTQYEYDALDRLTRETNELGDSRTFQYDAASNLTRTTDRNARTTQYVYDALDRRVEERWLDTANQPVNVITSTYDAASQLLDVADPRSAYRFTYDVAGRLTRLTNAGTVGVPELTWNLAYDAVNNVTQRVAHFAGGDQSVDRFSYDALDRLTRVTQTGATTPDKRIDFTYDATSQLIGIQRFADLAGAQPVVETHYQFDNAGRLIDLEHENGSVIATYQWTYDAAHRLTQASTPDGDSSYTYNDRDELLLADHSSQSDETYTYDATGNRTSGGTVTGADNRLLSDGRYTYEYDREGNRSRRTETATGAVTNYTWDHRNRLTRVQVRDVSGTIIRQVDYGYDVFNNRIAKAVDLDGAGPGAAETEHYAYAGDHIAYVFDEAGQVRHRYLHGPLVDQILADEDASGNVLWPLADHLGTVRDLVDSAGSVVDHRTYDSFGRRLDQTDPAVDHLFGFTGREFDEELGLAYYRARYYDPDAGRFISEDPIGFAAGDANVFRYVGNNPLAWVDPYGLEQESQESRDFGSLMDLIDAADAAESRAASGEALEGNVDRNVFLPGDGDPPPNPPSNKPPAPQRDNKDPKPPDKPQDSSADENKDEQQKKKEEEDPECQTEERPEFPSNAGIPQLGNRELPGDGRKLLLKGEVEQSRILPGDESLFKRIFGPGLKNLVLYANLVDEIARQNNLGKLTLLDAKLDEFTKRHIEGNVAVLYGGAVADVILLVPAGKAVFDIVKAAPGAIRSGHANLARLIGSVRADRNLPLGSLVSNLPFRRNSPVTIPSIQEFLDRRLHEVNAIHVDENALLNRPNSNEALSRAINCVNCNLAYWHSKIGSPTLPRAVSALPLSQRQLSGFRVDVALRRLRLPAPEELTRIMRINPEDLQAFPRAVEHPRVTRELIRWLLRRSPQGSGGIVKFSALPREPSGHVISVEKAEFGELRYIDVQLGRELSLDEVRRLFTESVEVNGIRYFREVGFFQLL